MKIMRKNSDNLIEENDEKRLNCGTADEHSYNTADNVPKTITELKQYCLRNGFTPERTRFFVGQDYRNPKAFGIYQDENGEFVVYKNKANGQRAIRYRGNDEAYAVKELYLRLQAEIQNQIAAYNNQKREVAYSKKKKHNPHHRGTFRIVHTKRQRLIEELKGLALCIAFILLFVAIFNVAKFVKKRNDPQGYYSYGNETYYNLGDSWYLWYYLNPGLGWRPTSVDSDLEENWRDYRIDEAPSDTEPFENTEYYATWETHRNSSSNSGGWSVGSWNSNHTNWSSDW